MIVLAIDVSLSSSGYCVITDKREILRYGKVATNKKDFKSEHERMLHISKIFENIIKEYNVDEVVMEEAFIGRNIKGGMALKKLQGYLCKTFKNIHHVSTVTPAAWRKALLNSNKAVKKEDVIKYIRENVIDIGELKSSTKMKNEDTYESIGLAIGYLNDRENIIKNNLY